MILDLPAKSIGHIGGGKLVRTGRVDVAVIQSLYRKDEVKDFVAEYGQIIVDECHHISAFTFEQVMKQAKARYVVGLNATPTRKDGHHPIIYSQSDLSWRCPNTVELWQRISRSQLQFVSVEIHPYAL